jgi:hypothetical protein
VSKLRIVIKVDGTDTVIYYINQVNTNEFPFMVVKNFSSKIMGTIDEILKILFLGNLSMPPTVFGRFPRMVCIVENDMLFTE